MNPSSPPFVQIKPSLKTSGDPVQTPSIASSQKPSFREKYRLSSPALSPITGNLEPTGRKQEEEALSSTNHLIPITQPNNQRPISLNLKELLNNKKDKSQLNSPINQAFTLDIKEVSSNSRSNNPVDVPQTRNGQPRQEEQRATSPVLDISFSEEIESDHEDSDEVQAQLDRILNKRKEREELIKEASTNKEEETEDILEMIRERRKQRENLGSLDLEVHNIDVGELELFNDDQQNDPATTADVDIMNEFLSKSNLNSKDNSFAIESPKRPLIPKLSLSPNVEETHSSSKQKAEEKVINSEAVKEKGSTVQEERTTISQDQTSPQKVLPPNNKASGFETINELKSETSNGPISTLQGTLNESSSVGFNGSVSEWRIPDQRWKLFNAPSSFMNGVFNMADLEQNSYIHTTLLTYENEPIPVPTVQQMAMERKLAGYQENYFSNLKTTPQFDPAMKRLNEQPPENMRMSNKPFKFKNLEDLFVNQFELIGENGLRRFAFRYDLNGNFLRCLKTNQAFLPFVSLEEDCIQKIIVGCYVYKNTPKGQVHKRFAYVDPKSKELTWSDSETKKKSSSNQRSSRRVKLVDIVSIKVLEMTHEQARAMKIVVTPEVTKRFYGVVIISRTRSVEFVLYETRNFFISFITGLALCVHKLSQNA
ncbi:hypothetical protein FDP41_013141 [Naegleria fowleri]|uniref:Pleckstrin homology domain-containing protein n=1 Tax=Naegleria fowleri TaxID=5763 RepID=A0A6A5C470_NAEFO|nr:uncharacterized protein FDP41_013141 [Naegleria fowleri]KAF0980658.1 hypothetical protein FDP41_013141 [Naegleria fowleri]